MQNTANALSLFTGFTQGNMAPDQFKIDYFFKIPKKIKIF